MADILFNKQGTPLIVATDSFFASTNGGMLSGEQLLSLQKQMLAKFSEGEENKDITDLPNGVRMLNWGRTNNTPQLQDAIISSTSVLNSGLKFIRNFTIGQGIMACKVTGYKDNGDEILEPYGDVEVNNFLNSRMVREYMECAARDYFKFGSGAVQMIANKGGNKILSLHTLNAYYWRLSTQNNEGRRWCITSGKFPNMVEKGEYQTYKCLLDYNPTDDLARQLEKKETSVVFVVRDSWSNRDVYSEPIWLSAYLAGWVDVAKEVPVFLKKIYANQASWKWHIQIPSDFWNRFFPATDYKSTEDRQVAIEEWIDKWEKNNLGSDNAEKPIITEYSETIEGKSTGGWKIESLVSNSSTTENLVTSAAANSEILFALMINPNVLGAGMPGKTYGGSQGGSNIREGFLVNIANAWLDRQNLLDPLYIKLYQDGHRDVAIRYRNTILTTLDTGAGTQKNLA